MQATAGSGRFDRVDAVRGLAIVWMALYHFAFDLDHFGFIRQNFYENPVWTVQRTCIVTLFLFVVGVSQALALAAGQPWARFWRRWGQIAGCALLVSVGSWWMFPRSWISFGVLQAIAVALIVLRLSAGAGRALWLIGAVAIVLPQFVHHPFFDARWANWTGLVTKKPTTEDWVPLFPWLGVVWWGCAAGQWLLARHPAQLAAALPAPLGPLAKLGRWSLSFYMLHQPVLIAVVAAAAAWRGGAGG